MFSNKSGHCNTNSSDANFRSYLQILTYITAGQHALTFHNLKKVIYYSNNNPDYIAPMFSAQ